MLHQTSSGDLYSHFWSSLVGHWWYRVPSYTFYLFIWNALKSIFKLNLISSIFLCTGITVCHCSKTWMLHTRYLCSCKFCRHFLGFSIFHWCNSSFKKERFLPTYMKSALAFTSAQLQAATQPHYPHPEVGLSLNAQSTQSSDFSLSSKPLNVMNYFHFHEW